MVNWIKKQTCSRKKEWIFVEDIRRYVSYVQDDIAYSYLMNLLYLFLRKQTATHI